MLIFFHEAGHFLAATLQGIRVTGFSIGFGPSLIEKKYKGITYSIRFLPLGGFVSFPDVDEENNIAKDDPDLLKNRPIIQRAIVISAGVFANLLLAWLVLIAQSSFIGIPTQAEQGVTIMATQKELSAYSAGLIPGDNILNINGKDLGKGRSAVEILVKEIQNSPGKEIELKAARGDEIKYISITPEDKEGKGMIGAQLQPNISGELRRPEGVKDIIRQSNDQFINILLKTIYGYKGLVTNFAETSQQLSGPVKIIEIGAQLSQQGSNGLIIFAALVSINLAVLNSLPLPLLDGGQFTILILEAIRGKPIPERIQLLFMQTGFILLVGLSLLLIVKDISQLTLVKKFISH